MKTSRKILLLVAGLVIAALIIFIVLMKSTVKELHSKMDMKKHFQQAATGSFERLYFSAPFIVRIKQGKVCKVEFALENDTMVKPILDIRNGTLYCAMDSACQNDSTGKINIRITMPLLQEIEADHGTEIRLENFSSDSISVRLGNGCDFKGSSNTFKRTYFKTTGNASIQISSIF